MSYVLPLEVPSTLFVEGASCDREQFYSWLWARFGDQGLLGVHEGTLLSEEAASLGLETESWLVDSGEAPRERDWIGSLARSHTTLYFSDRPFAQTAVQLLSEIDGLGVGAVAEQKDEDWDAKWKASFTGVRVAPFWNVIPPWIDPAQQAGRIAGDVDLRVNPGAGFGTGTHETTQLCLGALGQFAQTQSLRGARVLDFGSGSGILAIGAALLGATVEGVEIDELAIDNALDNARMNGVEERVRFFKTLQIVRGEVPVVMANILKPVLLEFADELASRLAVRTGSRMILSGLIDRDVEEVSARFSALLLDARCEVRELNEWRAVIFTR